MVVDCLMASLYERGNRIWISYRGEDGGWHDKSTGFRVKNPIERKNAQRLREAQTSRERLATPVTTAGGWEWVDSWLGTTWEGGTRYQYRKNWSKLHEWLVEKALVNPAAVSREHCLGYKDWRIAQGVKANTAILEAKFLGQIMQEAVNQGRCATNPARKLGLKRTLATGKRAWTDQELATVDADLRARDPYGWLRVTYLLGRYQAARISSCALPLACINFNLEPPQISYPSPKGGEERAYTQPIDKHLLPALRDIVEHRKNIGATTLCDLPEWENAKQDSDGPGAASYEWRQYLDGLGIHGVSHKSLRITWITEAAIKGIPEAMACKFSNHSSLTVHRIYQQFTTNDMADMLDRLG